MAETQHIIVIDSYAKTPEQVEALSAAVRQFAQLGCDLCLVSHLPIPESALHSSVKYVIYDSNNILGEEPVVFCYKIGDLEVRCNSEAVYHGAAVYSSLYNSLKRLAHRYEWVHFVEYDVDVDDVAKHVHERFKLFANEKDLKVLGYPFYHEDPALVSTAILTNLISIRPEVVDALPLISSWKDYCAFYPGKPPILEVWMLDRLKSQNIQHRFVGTMKVRERSHLGGEHLVFKCRQYDSLYSVFAANQSTRAMEVRFRSGASYQLAAGNVFFLGGASPDDEVIVTYAGDATAHRHPLSTMKLGIFKKEGFNLCPDWK